MLTNIGAMWRKDGAKGAFYSGQIDFEKVRAEGGVIRILAFPLKDKKNPKQPDVEIFEADDRPEPPKEVDTML